MQIYFDSRICSYLPRVPILVEGPVHVCAINLTQLGIREALTFCMEFP